MPNGSGTGQRLIAELVTRLAGVIFLGFLQSKG
jgi:hypothetical protein